MQPGQGAMAPQGVTPTGYPGALSPQSTAGDIEKVAAIVLPYLLKLFQAQPRSAERRVGTAWRARQGVKQARYPGVGAVGAIATRCWTDDMWHYVAKYGHDIVAKRLP